MDNRQWYQYVQGKVPAKSPENNAKFDGEIVHVDCLGKFPGEFGTVTWCPRHVFLRIIWYLRWKGCIGNPKHAVVECDK